MRRVQRVGERFGKSAKKALLFEKRSKNFFQLAGALGGR
jgi:hypothetical protein